MERLIVFGRKLNMVLAGDRYKEEVGVEALHGELASAYILLLQPI